MPRSALPHSVTTNALPASCLKKDYLPNPGNTDATLHSTVFEEALKAVLELNWHLDAGWECTQCHVSAHKYRCPACDTRTCSLACSQAHKQASGCTGKRSRTDMVTLSDFTERQLLSDYKFLEEAARLNDVAKRSGVPRPATQLPHGLQVFVDQV